MPGLIPNELTWPNLTLSNFTLEIPQEKKLKARIVSNTKIRYVTELFNWLIPTIIPLYSSCLLTSLLLHVFLTIQELFYV